MENSSSGSMEIMHIITGTKTGGAETMLANVVMDRQPGFSHVVLSMCTPGPVGERLEEAGIQVLSLDMKDGRPSLRALFALLCLARSRNPQVIVGWMYHGALASYIFRLAVKTKAGLIWNIRHSLDDLGKEAGLTRIVIFLNKLISSRVDRVLYNSARSKVQHEAYGFSARAGLVIPNGFDCELFDMDWAARQMRRSELGFGESEFVVGYVARCHPVKDYETFLQVAFKLCQMSSAVRFLWAGRDADAKNENLLSMISDMGLAGRVVLLGEVSPISSLYSAFDLLILTSISEGLPNVIGEAMSVGLPCVATDVGDVSELVRDPGLICAVGDVSGLVGACARVMEWSRAERRVAASESRNLILEEYHLPGVLERYRDLFLSSCER